MQQVASIRELVAQWCVCRDGEAAQLTVAQCDAACVALAHFKKVFHHQFCAVQKLDLQVFAFAARHHLASVLHLAIDQLLNAQLLPFGNRDDLLLSGFHCQGF